MVRVLNERAASGVEIGLLSDYPERRRQFLGAGRITVDAREKDILMVKMPSVSL
jgi:hypothetical protein